MESRSSDSYDKVLDSIDIIGFSVETRDGTVGKVDEATCATTASWIVVDTGPWIFGKKVMLPAATIGSIDYEKECVYVSQGRDAIRNAPEFDEDWLDDALHRDEPDSH